MQFYGIGLVDLIFYMGDIFSELIVNNKVKKIMREI